MKIVVYKASDPYLDGGSRDMISTNVGTFKKQVILSSKTITYIDLKSGEKISDIEELEQALGRYNKLQKIKNKNVKWKQLN
jgi:hypothetical protein